MRKYQEILDEIREIYNEPKDFIPLHAPVFIGNEKKYLNECIDSTFVSSKGKFVDLFEEKVAEYTGAKKAVVCVNGTNALHLALKMVGVTSDTEVITQPLTFVATANAIRYCDSKPVFLDVDIDTMGLSPNSLLCFLENETEQKTEGCFNINTGKRIAACVPMHTFGHPCRIDKIAEICEMYNIPMVEDAAESVGSFFKGQHTGTFGKVGVFSFNGNKIITTGGGGMLLFMDEDLANQAKHLTIQAKVPHLWDFVHDEIGYNYRMPNINAAMGLAQLEQLPIFLESKRKIAAAYKRYFDQRHDLGVSFISEPADSNSNYWLNSIQFHTIEERNSFLKFSNENGVMTRPTWKLMNELDIFLDCQTDDLLNAKLLSDSVVNIPSSVRY
ncbi:MAG: LegC family aminotransferase [Bacteroidales bacterium]|nr:LegC family aminotransferase [Bacteroidales bacterium]